jgi:CMP-N-acetylneuraminic acid synthetase/GT2 family glycosyltransferase|tara:strand:+ start:631 stop:1989 length:1359 start_codon:yes stop_codon:yes gene_type:complete
MGRNPKVSIIIRTKNEERWISSCLESVYNQEYADFDVIIVDNESEDKTLKKASQFPVTKVVPIKDYLPGKALNTGIDVSRGDYIVCLSGHCVAVNELWLGNLVTALEEDEAYAGVYGRQEPMSFSSPADKRDLLIVFGLDRRIQTRDSFFHNANSIIRRKLWEEVPFDDNITNIEDRIWAQEMLDKGYKLVYEPEASVHHYHGIHQDGDHERLSNVVSIIEEKHTYFMGGRLDANKLNIIAIIPVKGKQQLLNGRPQLSYTIDEAINSKFIDKTFVATDNEDTAEIAGGLGAECPFLRPQSLSEPYVNLETVQQFALGKIEDSGLYPDLVMHLEETFPFRPKGLLDEMISHLLEEGYDSVIAARPENSFLWQEDDRGNFVRLDSGDVPRKFKEKSYVGLHGLGVVTHPEFIRQERMLGDSVGLYVVHTPLAGFEVRDKESRKIAETFQDNFI